MDRMSRTLWAIGWLGSLVVVAAVVTGFQLAGTTDPAVPRHVLIALAATLAASFCHLWAGVYLWGLGRAIARTVAEGGLPAAALAEARALRTPALLWIGLALLLTFVLFGLGGPTVSGALAPPIHQALAWGALAAQAMALLGERKSLGGMEGLLRGAAEPGS